MAEWTVPRVPHETSPGSILWYVHDQGLGHLGRADAVLDHLESPVVVATGRSDAAARLAHRHVDVVELPSDVAPGASGGPGPFHHVPVDRCSAARAGAILDAVRAHGCTTAVIDLSVEATVLSRLAGLRVITVRQSGTREDAAHRLGFSSADVVWHPGHAELEPLVSQSGAPPVFHSGGFSRFDPFELGRDEARRLLGLAGHSRIVVLMVGSGGHGLPDAAWRRTTDELDARVFIVGLDERWRNGSVTSLGRVTNPFSWLVAADAVVTSGGWASVHEVVAARTSFAAIPEPRPFDEQLARVRSLDRHRLCVELDRWPGPSELSAVVERITSLDPTAWDQFYDRKGAARAADMIEGVHRG